MKRDSYARFVIAELEKIHLAEPPHASMHAEAISKNMYMSRQEIDIESDIKVATREYVVREGDTLWSIANRELGSSHRWKNIYALNMNRIPDPDHLRMGMRLNIPIE